MTNGDIDFAAYSEERMLEILMLAGEWRGAAIIDIITANNHNILSLGMALGRACRSLLSGENPEDVLDYYLFTEMVHWDIEGYGSLEEWVSFAEMGI